MQQLFEKLNIYCKELIKESDQISPERKADLQQLSNYILNTKAAGETAKIIVICTHNSRRSHLGQLWLAVSTVYFQVADIQTFSGGTEATALNPRVVKALQTVGFSVTSEQEESDNSHYHISWSKQQTPAIAFSKKYSAPPNPTTDFAAVMVCSEADVGCPMVAGADFRLSLPYDDPKAFDDTHLETEKYLERCQQIGREMFYVMEQVKQER